MSSSHRPSFHSAEHGLNILLTVARTDTQGLHQLEENFAALFSLEASDSASDSNAPPRLREAHPHTDSHTGGYLPDLPSERQSTRKEANSIMSL